MPMKPKNRFSFVVYKSPVTPENTTESYYNDKNNNVEDNVEVYESYDSMTSVYRAWDYYIDLYEGYNYCIKDEEKHKIIVSHSRIHIQYNKHSIHHPKEIVRMSLLKQTSDY